MIDQKYQELEDIVNKSPAIAFLWCNEEGWPVEFVTKNINQFGYDPSDFLSGKIKFAQIIHKDDLERVSQEVENYSSSTEREDFTQEYRILTKDGEIRWIDDRTWIRRNSNGEITHFQGIVLDISNRKFLEEKLLKSEEQYRLISEHANDLISVLDAKFRIEYINESIHKRLIGYTKEDLIGMNGMQIVHPDDQLVAAEGFKELNKSGEALVIARIRNKNGEYLWTETKGNSYFDTKGTKKILLITRDISERKKSKKRLEASEEKYRVAYEHENFYKDLFTHDIKNILQSILSILELHQLEIKASGIELQDQKVFIELENQILRGSNLIKNVRKFSEFAESNVKLKKVDLIENIKKAFENVKSSEKDKNVSISYDLLNDRTIIHANDLLDDVTENILLNAIIHNENKNVEILIKTSKINKDNDRFTKIEFIDNGRGIPDYKKNLIFQRGFLDEKKTGGMGLGLSLAKIILESFKSKVWVENKISSDFSKGSNFVILFPEVSD